MGRMPVECVSLTLGSYFDSNRIEPNQPFYHEPGVPLLIDPAVTALVRGAAGLVIPSALTGQTRS